MPKFIEHLTSENEIEMRNESLSITTYFEFRQQLCV